MAARVGTWWQRHWRGCIAALAGLAGLALLALGPAGIVLGAQELRQWQARMTMSAGPQPGTTVRDGPASFIVHELRCGDGGERSRFGQLCELTIEARNHGDEPLTVPGMAQHLRSSQGARLAPAGKQPEPFGTLAPDQAATATIRYDLPARATVTHVEVHATAYTRGRAVAIAGGPLPLPAETGE